MEKNQELYKEFQAQQNNAEYQQILEQQRELEKLNRKIEKLFITIEKYKKIIKNLIDSLGTSIN